MHYASLGLRGPYGAVGKGLVELKRLMDSVGVRPSGKPFVLLYDNPAEAPEEELRSEAYFPVSGPSQSRCPLGLKESAGGTVAETRHTGPPAEYTRTYGGFLESLIDMGHSLEGRPARSSTRPPTRSDRAWAR